MVRRVEWYATPVRHAESTASDSRQPNWLRAYFYACARSGRQGHARFAAGELDGLLGVRSGDASKHVAQAVGRGLLLPESNVACLVLPEGYGHKMKGYEPPCDRHDRPAKTAGRNGGKSRNRPAISTGSLTGNPAEMAGPIVAPVGVPGAPCLVVSGTDTLNVAQDPMPSTLDGQREAAPAAAAGHVTDGLEVQHPTPSAMGRAADAAAQAQEYERASATVLRFGVRGFQLVERLSLRPDGLTPSQTVIAAAAILDKESTNAAS